MQKILNIQEIHTSEWPGLFKKALGDNLISAFIHGNCLMEGFSALKEPWNISFILKSNIPSDLEPLKELAPRAKRSNIAFGYMFTANEILSLWQDFPLEFLHIAYMHEVVCGAPPIAVGAVPMFDLQRQCYTELRGFLIQLRHQLTCSKLSYGRIAAEMEVKLLPILYGIYFLQTGEYPKSADHVYIHFQHIPSMSVLSHDNVDNIETYVQSLEAIANQLTVGAPEA